VRAPKKVETEANEVVAFGSQKVVVTHPDRVLSSLRPLSPTMTVGNLAPVRQSALNRTCSRG
jgi:hypothetical protein